MTFTISQSLLLYNKDLSGKWLINELTRVIIFYSLDVDKISTGTPEVIRRYMYTSKVESRRERIRRTDSSCDDESIKRTKIWKNMKKQ